MSDHGARPRADRSYQGHQPGQLRSRSDPKPKRRPYIFTAWEEHTTASQSGAWASAGTPTASWTGFTSPCGPRAPEGLPGDRDWRPRGRRRSCSPSKTATAGAPPVDRGEQDAVRDTKRRGLNEPQLVVADDALGAWAALRDVYPGASAALLASRPGNTSTAYRDRCTTVRRATWA
jgi:hypothetical protein